MIWIFLESENIVFQGHRECRLSLIRSQTVACFIPFWANGFLHQDLKTAFLKGAPRTTIFQLQNPSSGLSSRKAADDCLKTLKSTLDVASVSCGDVILLESENTVFKIT